MYSIDKRPISCGRPLSMPDMQLLMRSTETLLTWRGGKLKSWGSSSCDLRGVGVLSEFRCHGGCGWVTGAAADKGTHPPQAHAVSSVHPHPSRRGTGGSFGVEEKVGSQLHCVPPPPFEFLLPLVMTTLVLFLPIPETRGGGKLMMRN